MRHEMLYNQDYLWREDTPNSKPAPRHIQSLNMHDFIAAVRFQANGRVPVKTQLRLAERIYSVKLAQMNCAALEATIREGVPVYCSADGHELLRSDRAADGGEVIENISLSDDGACILLECFLRPPTACARSLRHSEIGQGGFQYKIFHHSKKLQPSNDGIQDGGLF